MIITPEIQVYNFTSEERIYEDNGVKFQHLGTIKIKERIFIIYKVLSSQKIYIEEAVSNKLTDNLVDIAHLKVIEDDNLWKMLILIARKEGIISLP